MNPESDYSDYVIDPSENNFSDYAIDPFYKMDAASAYQSTGLTKLLKEISEGIISNEGVKRETLDKPKKLEIVEARIQKALAIHEEINDPRPGKDSYCGFCSSAYPCVTVVALTATA